MVLEIVSPDDDSWSKFGLFAAHAVDEVLIVDPQKRSVDWFALDRSSPSGPTPGYSPIGRSGLIELGAAELAQRLDWPALEQ